MSNSIVVYTSTPGYIITFFGYFSIATFLIGRLICLWAMGLTLCQSTGNKKEEKYINKDA